MSEKSIDKLFFYNKRGHEGSSFFEWYRCFDEGQAILFSARADRFGKPMPVIEEERTVVEIRNRKGYLVNGRTDIQCQDTGQLLGSYSRLGQVCDAANQKIGRWRDGRKWSEEFKENLIDAIGNALLGSGDVPGGVNASRTHLLSRGKEVLAVLRREQLPFFPDPPKSMQPGMFAKLASRIIPGQLGKSLGEVTPPYGWTLSILESSSDRSLVRYSALIHLEFLRWARSM